MLLLTAVPGEIWHHPAIDEQYAPFDQNLVSQVDGPTSSANLLTTPYQRFDASLDITPAPTGPARLAVWSPWTHAGAILSFDVDSAASITLDLIAGGVSGPTLLGGKVIARRSLGAFTPGVTNHVDVSFDRDSREVVFRVGGGSATATGRVTGHDLPNLFLPGRISLTASAVGAPNSLQIEGYSVRLPHQRFWAVRTDGWMVRLAMLALGLLGIGLLIWDFATRRRWRPADWGGQRWETVRSFLRRHQWPVVAGALMVGGYLLVSALSFGLGAQPFDMANEKVYAYVGTRYGPDQLYYLPSLVSPAWIWGGTPFIEASFPYEPTFAYLFTGIGWLHGLISNVWGPAGSDAAQLEYTIKAANVLFAVADAVVIYLISRELGTTRPWRLIPAVLFLINPAVWFSASVWGQTHVISLFLFLLAIWLMERKLLFASWLLLAATALTRPQMLVLCLLLAIVLIRRFPWKATIVSVAQAGIATFIFLLPLTLATGPSLPVDVMLNDLRIQEAGGNQPELTTLSQGAYSIWPLVSDITTEAQGLGRLFTPSARSLFGKLTYQTVGQWLTLVAVFLVAIMLWIRAPSFGPGNYLPYLALGITAFLLLMTGLVATHYVLAIPFLLLSKRQLGAVGFFSLITLWTAITFIPMYGDMGNVIGLLGFRAMPLNPASNVVTRFVINVYAADRVITAGALANLCVVVWLALASIRNPQNSPLASGSRRQQAISIETAGRHYS
jgi:hypothetical protein